MLIGMQDVIEVSGARKSFKTYETPQSGFLASIRKKRIVKRALRGVSLEVKQGDIAALLGKNGSGNFINNVLNLLSSTSKYPLNIYGIFPQLLLSILLPVGIATYYPAELLLGRISIPAYAGFLLFSVAVIVVSRYLIHKLMERYTGGGG